jgi:hypothetical protein
VRAVKEYGSPTPGASKNSRFRRGAIIGKPGSRSYLKRRRQGECDMDKAREALEELLNDPMVRLVMASDGVEAEEVRNLFGASDDEGDDSGLPALHVIASLPCGQGLCCI